VAGRAGHPGVRAKAQSRNFSSVDTARIACQRSGTVPSSQVIADWSTQEWVRFIDGLGATQPLDKLATLDKALPLHRHPEWRDRHALVPAGDPQRLRAGQ
jgi:hypothetical protein